jgi:hypothetical protein
MGIHRGPNPVKDGLVFGCDTGYGVADNDTTTRFYPGESTDNILRLFTSGNQSLSYGSHIYIVTAQETNVSDVTAPNGQYSRFTGNTNSSNNQVFWSYAGNSNNYTGSTVTFSTYLKGSGTCHLTTYDDQSGYGVSSTITLTNEWVRYSYTRTINASATSHWSGVRGILTSTNVYIAASQAEIKGHATPFTATTRSSTASLIDLKKTTDIDVSSVSFDSTGQPTFDNTDDRITMPNSSVFNHTSELSIEAWVKFDGNSADFIFEKGNVNTQYSLFSHGSDIVFRTLHAGDGGYQSLGPSKTTAGITNGQWHHIVGSWDGSTKRIYVDGVDKASVSKSGALTTTSNGAAIGSFGGTSSGYYFGGEIAIVKIYDKGLSATEVKQNYNSHKNRFDI